MHKITGSDITLTRGDSLVLNLQLTKGGETYTPEQGSEIRFAMKKRYADADEDVVLIKQIPIDTLTLEFEPEDTKDLVMNKTYVYDIQLTDSNGRVDTFLSGKLTIAEEVL